MYLSWICCLGSDLLTLAKALEQIAENVETNARKQKYWQEGQTWKVARANLLHPCPLMMSLVRFCNGCKQALHTS